MLKVPVNGSTRKDQALLGRAVCQHSFRQLLGIGPKRFERLKRCALTDCPLPVDGRQRPRRHDGTNHESVRKRGLITDFLEEIYNSMSEPMPEASDQGQVEAEQGDHYVMPKMKFRRNRGKNPGKRLRDMTVKTCTLKDTPVRLLPPGSFSEYLEMLQAKHPGEKFSLKLFCTVPCLWVFVRTWSSCQRSLSVTDAPPNIILEVWGSNFTKMAIRRSSQHASCSTCCRHKMILKRLGADKRARAMQMQEYQRHLHRTYQDRVRYWLTRSQSRLGIQPSGISTLTLICDGMDKSKYRYPRSAVCNSKEFSGLVRPALDVTAVICHGHNVVLACSEPFVQKGSSWTTELVAHSIDKVAQKTDVRGCEIQLQMDNCGRENKNNSLCRLAGILTGSGRCYRMQLNFLESGHSHEDIDQYFSSLSNLIESRREIHTPDQFVAVLDRFMQDASIRPHEESRFVYKVDAVRDWKLGPRSDVDSMTCIYVPLHVWIIQKFSECHWLSGKRIFT